METKVIINEAEKLRNELKLKQDNSSNPIDIDLPIIPPFIGGKEIKLIVIGQDPTIRNKDSRKNEAVTLNLDKNNSLRKYVETSCKGLGIKLENVYATNIFKYFYTVPPSDTFNVMYEHLQPNLDLLNKELSAFKNIPVITLGEPVLRLLKNDEAKVKYYWDYNYKKSNGNYRFCEASENKLGMKLFPFPHQPSVVKKFYKEELDNYLNFMRNN